MKRFGRRLEELLERTGTLPRVLVLLDYDGTLVPIRSRPDLAKMTDEQRATLEELNTGRLRLAMLSGRSVADLRARVDLPDIIYAGVFGSEMREPGWHFIQPAARGLRGPIKVLAGRLRRHFEDIPGARVEDKGVGVCVHYRNVPDDHRVTFDRRVAEVRADCPPGMRWRHGQKSWEISALAPWNKGKAALLLWRRLGKPYLLAFGDDVFDEATFRAVQGRGAGVRVGRGRSAARYRLADPAAVHHFLRRLADRAGRPLKPWLRRPPVRPAKRAGPSEIFRDAPPAEAPRSRRARAGRRGSGGATRSGARGPRASRAGRAGRS